MENKEYNVYRGLQKPIVLYGLKGSIIGWTIGTFAAVCISFITLSSFAGMVTALIGSLIPACIGGYKVWHKTTYGLHDKKRHKGVIIVRRSMSSFAS